MRDIPYGYCHCGCGGRTELCPYTARSIGWVKGEPKRYIHGHQSRKPVVEYIVAENGCWIWQRHIGKKGYGTMRPYGSKTMRPAHIVYYERVKGPVPDGLTLDHLCHTHDPACPGGPTCQHRRCVNPDHLEPVSSVENAKRGRAPGPKAGYKKPRPTHCKRGHEFTPENRIVGPDGGWRCRTCRNIQQLERYHARKRGGVGPKPNPSIRL